MDYYYNYQYSIAATMYSYNVESNTKHFSLIDAHILSLVKSFHDSKQNFYMKNSDIADIMLVSELTVKRSIDKLCSFGFLSKEPLGKRSFDGRLLIYHDKLNDNSAKGFKVDLSLSKKFMTCKQKDKLSLIDLSIASLVAAFSNNNNFFYMSNNTMQSILLVSQPVISKSIKTLEKYNVVTVDKPSRTITFTGAH